MQKGLSKGLSIGLLIVGTVLGGAGVAGARGLSHGGPAFHGHPGFHPGLHPGGLSSPWTFSPGVPLRI